MKSVLKALNALKALRTVAGGASLSILVACGGGGGSGSVNTTMQSFAETLLVSDGAVPAAHTDANLKHGWGVAFNPNGFVWVADNNFLYATDFHNNKIDVFDRTFTKVAMPGGFRDPSLPAGFAPFGIQAIGTRLFVTYAQQDPDAQDDVAGAGLGFVDVFDTEGNFRQRFASGGPLNAPWGIAQAPSSFGPFSNAVLIGNFGDGMIHAFDQSSGLLMGTLNTANGAAFVQAGLWGIAFGNGLDNQPVNTLFFAAGPNDEANGVYGRIDVQTTSTTSMPMM
ncbi:TIGR03118 family protein [Paraburkholderia edwinii]|uniref:TIGR03118 family protein n=1 Tax=Paraburkholderia edwinii TaxID=2861782 RepID=A0ABX8UYQ9_9BURK|nr:TIGR03118 family protein [Paraburkholderia edwinii]QYD71993.1 TIGR03118 family protein [Paraburkholderia edwinii]